MSIDYNMFKKWKPVDSGRTFRRVFPYSKCKNKKKGKNNKKGQIADCSVTREKKKETHHVWPKPYRQNHDVIRKNDTKQTAPEEHDIWNKYSKNLHPKIAFRNIISLCMSKTTITEEEANDLAILAGFDWRIDRNAAIEAIFRKFMPDELGEILKPYLIG